MELIDPADIPATTAIIGEALSDTTGKSYELQYRFKHKNDGSYRWVLDKFMVMRNVAGEPVALIGSVNDITPRMLAENENKRIQKLLEDSQRVGKIGGWEYNIDTSELIWTPEMYQIHEVDSDYKPSIEKRVNFYTPESLALVDEAVKKVIETGESYEIESEIITAKGNHKIARAIGQADLRNRRIYGFFQDITERKQAETNTRESELRFKTLFMNSPAGLMVLDENGIVLQANDEMVKISLYTIEELIGADVRMLTRTEENYQVSENIARIFAGETLDFEFQSLRKDGSLVYLIIKEVAITLPNGRRGVLSVSNDISKRKQAEEALRKSEEKYRTLFENVQDVFYQVDMNGKILEISPSIERLPEFNLEQLLGSSVFDLYNDPVDRTIFLNDLKSKGELKDYELTIKSNSGVVKHVSINARLNLDENGLPHHIDGAVRDITERKEVELAQLKLSEELLHFGRLAVNRENRMVQLKKEINELLIKQGGEAKYEIFE